jgi:hypothetical protein
MSNGNGCSVVGWISIIGTEVVIGNVWNVTQAFKFLQKFFWVSLLFLHRGVLAQMTTVTLWYKIYRGWGVFLI